MNVRELIEELKKHDPEAMVIESGYEGGVGEITEVEEVMIKLNVNTEWYYGAHQESKEGTTKAVYIS